MANEPKTPDFNSAEGDETIEHFLQRVGFSNEVVADDGRPLSATAAVQATEDIAWPQTPQLFTVEEAIALVPEARKRVLAVQEASRRLQEERAAMEQLKPWQIRSEDNRRGAQAARLAEAVHNMRTSIDHLQALGCELKDVEMGLIDFPSMRNGEIVNLCWRMGEDTINFWHGLDEGFRYRKQL